MSGANTDNSYKKFKELSAKGPAVGDTYNPKRMFEEFYAREALEKAARQKENEPFSYQRKAPRVDNCVPPPKSTEEMSAFEKKING